jgi:hypothetical protein
VVFLVVAVVGLGAFVGVGVVLVVGSPHVGEVVWSAVVLVLWLVVELLVLPLHHLPMRGWGVPLDLVPWLHHVLHLYLLLHLCLLLLVLPPRPVLAVVLAGIIVVQVMVLVGRVVLEQVVVALAVVPAPVLVPLGRLVLVLPAAALVEVEVVALLVLVRHLLLLPLLPMHHPLNCCLLLVGGDLKVLPQIHLLSSPDLGRGVVQIRLEMRPLAPMKISWSGRWWLSV